MDDETLLSRLDKIFYEDNFSLDSILENLPHSLECGYLIDYKERLEKLLAVVSRKVSEVVTSHQPTYVDELQRIADLQASITDSIRACSQSRHCLKFIKEGTQNAMTIIEHNQQRESLAKLIEPLTAISNLRNSVLEIRNLIENQDDIPRAIQMCKDSRTLLSSLQHFKCVRELESNSYKKTRSCQIS